MFNKLFIWYVLHITFIICTYIVYYKKIILKNIFIYTQSFFFFFLNFQKIPFNKLKHQRISNKVYRRKLQQEIYRHIQKKKQDKINNELKKLRFNELVDRNNITQADLKKIKQLNNLDLKTLQKIAQQRNINTTGLKKKNLIYSLIRSEKSHKEDNYIKYLNKDINNEIHNKINSIRLQLVNISSYLKKTRIKSNK